MSVEKDFEEWLRSQKAQGLESLHLSVMTVAGATRERVLAELLRAERHLAVHGSGQPPGPAVLLTNA